MSTRILARDRGSKDVAVYGLCTFHSSFSILTLLSCPVPGCCLPVHHGPVANHPAIAGVVVNKARCIDGKALTETVVSDILHRWGSKIIAGRGKTVTGGRGAIILNISININSSININLIIIILRFFGFFRNRWVFPGLRLLF